MQRIPLVLLLSCFVGSHPAKSSSTAPDLLREAEKLLPYLRDVRRSVTYTLFYTYYLALLWMLSTHTRGVPIAEFA